MASRSNHTVNIKPPLEQIEREIGDRRRRIAELQSKIDTAPIGELLEFGDRWTAAIQAIEDGTAGSKRYQALSSAELRTRKVRIEAGLPETDVPVKAPAVPRPAVLRMPVKIPALPKGERDPQIADAHKWLRDSLAAFDKPAFRTQCAYTNSTHLALAAALMVLKSRNDLLERRLNEIEGRVADAGGGSHLAYRGVWVPDEPYVTGDFVTWGGSVWHCNIPTTRRPDAGDFTLAVKKGRDGKDAREGPQPTKKETIRYGA